VAFSAWYGVRAYSAAVAATGTQKAVDLRRVSDNATCTALIATDGTLDLTIGRPCNGNTQTVTAWVGASTARVSKMYDQTNGNACGAASCDVVQATAGNQPQLLLTGCGGGSALLPCLSSTGTTAPQALVAANNFTPAGTAVSLVAIATQHHITDSPQAPLMKASGGAGGTGLINSICGPSTTNNLCVGGSGSTHNQSATDDVFHAVLGVINGASSVMNVDGTETTFSMTMGSTASAPIAASNATAAGSDAASTKFGEGGFQDNVAWSSGTRTALCHNMRIYWGTGGSC
jgi:hypothetical protein